MENFLTNYKISIDFVTMVAAVLFGFFQWRISTRLKKLEDYVCLVALPDEQRPVIKLVNTGKVNLYLCEYKFPGESGVFERPRLIPANPVSEANFWLPTSMIGIQQGGFDFEIFLIDEHGREIVSTFGGNIDSFNSEDGKIIGRVWSYKTEVKKWRPQTPCKCC